jgi:hypothetical protein
MPRALDLAAWVAGVLTRLALLAAGFVTGVAYGVVEWGPGLRDGQPAGLLISVALVYVAAYLVRELAWKVGDELRRVAA